MAIRSMAHHSQQVLLAHLSEVSPFRLDHYPISIPLKGGPNIPRSHSRLDLKYIMPRLHNDHRHQTGNLSQSSGVEIQQDPHVLAIRVQNDKAPNDAQQEV